MEQIDTRDEEPSVVIICAGPPQCACEGDEAVAAQVAGCVWCRRIIIADDLSETETGPCQMLQ